MSGRLIRVSNGDLKAATYVVAVTDKNKAIELIRSSIGKPGDEINDLGRVSPELLKALGLEHGDFKSIDEPTISTQMQEQPAAAQAVDP